MASPPANRNGTVMARRKRPIEAIVDEPAGTALTLPVETPKHETATRQPGGSAVDGVVRDPADRESSVRGRFGPRQGWGSLFTLMAAALVGSPGSCRVPSVIERCRIRRWRMGLRYAIIERKFG